MGQELARSSYTHQRLEQRGPRRNHVYPTLPTNHRVSVARRPHSPCYRTGSRDRGHDHSKSLQATDRVTASHPGSDGQEDREREIQRRSVHNDARGHDARRESNTNGNIPPPRAELLQALRDKISWIGRERTLCMDDIVGNILAVDWCDDSRSRDDKGLILPPQIAPLQVVLVPIFYKEDDRANI